MKIKMILIYIITIILTVFITVSGTFAYFTATAGSKSNSATANTTKLEVIYTGGTEIDGDMYLVTRKEEGFNTTVNIKLSEESIGASSDLFIQIKEISAAIATEALIWEVYKTYQGEETFVKSGNFLQCGEGTKKCADGDKLYLVRDYELTTTETYFTVYIWLNGELVGGEAAGAVLKGHIGAATEKITTELSNS